MSGETAKPQREGRWSLRRVGGGLAPAGAFPVASDGCRPPADRPGGVEVPDGSRELRGAGPLLACFRQALADRLEVRVSYRRRLDRRVGMLGKLLQQRFQLVSHVVIVMAISAAMQGGDSGRASCRNFKTRSMIQLALRSRLQLESP